MSQQQPPLGYGPPGHPPQQQNYGPPPGPPPKKGMSTLTMVLAGFGVIFVLGAGSCVVCVGIGANAASKATTAGTKATADSGEPGAANSSRPDPGEPRNAAL